MANVKADIANMAVSRCGNVGDIENIDTPDTSQEKLCAKWFDDSMKMAMKEMMPNFAQKRRILAVDSGTPAFGYNDRYVYPNDCIRLMGLGNIRDKSNNYAVEGGYILCDADYSEDDSLRSGLPIRFVCYEQDVSKWTPEFVDEASWFLAYNINMALTQDVQKQSSLEKIIKEKKAECAALNSQENKVTVVNRSKFHEARTSGFPQKSLKY